MAFLEWFRRDKKITDYSPEDLRREEARLSIRETQTVARLTKAEAERDEVFRQGAVMRSPVRRRLLARRYEERHVEIRRLESELSRIMKESMTVAALRHRLEHRGKSETAILRKIGEADVESLREMAEDDRIHEDLYREKLSALLGALSGAEAEGDPLADLGTRGRAVLDVWQRMEEGKVAGVEEGLREVDALTEDTGPVSE